ncbi:MAG TPA: nitrous oxide-stimulated promoter family protein [Syntrophorhabdales bacterium]|nr:nitrous oxide-stimulated promoter family protein [Syntrophorhabdales bacterium]
MKASLRTITGLSRKEKADIRVLVRFIALFCRKKHEGEKKPYAIEATLLKDLVHSVELCQDCTKLLKYGLSMRLRCSHVPKPQCKKCDAPCYREEYREKIREVMRFSGMHLVKRGRLDLLYHYVR